MTKKISENKFELSLSERVIVATIMNSKNQWSFTDLIVRDDLRKKVLLTQKEIDLYEFKEIKWWASWNEKGRFAMFEYEITNLEIELLKKDIEALNDNWLLTSSHISLCKKFFSDEEIKTRLVEKPKKEIPKK